MENPKHVVVLGGTGLIGSHLLYLLAQRGKVIATARNAKHHKGVLQLFQHYNAELAEDWYKNITWVDLDILDILALQELLIGAKQVYHCAALVSFHRIDFYKCIAINRQGTANVVNTCLDFPDIELCYVSSTAALGRTAHGLIDENCPWKATDKNSGYSVSKYGAEKEVWRGIEEGLKAVIINPCTVLGPGRWEEGSMELFNAVNRGLHFYPSGSNATVDARDVAASMLFLMDNSHRSSRYLCTGTNMKFNALFDLIAQKMNKTKPKYYASFRLALPVAYLLETFSLLRGKRKGITIESTRSAYSNRAYDSSKLKALLPFTFHPVEDTIENAIQGRISI
jgi:nucleoside-diphosphate-sugar epimerase